MEPTAKPAKTPDTVVITIDRNGQPDYDSVELSKEGDQRILWLSDADYDYDIVFQDGSPFGSNFHLLKKGRAPSGPITAEPGHFKYDVCLADTKVVAADPDVIIKK